jgi:creatinine amidohydrolase
MSAGDVLYSVRGPKSWTTMTSHELADQLRETDVAMVPVGAIEQHAGHLPLGQDNFEIEEIVRRAVLKLRGDKKEVVFGPTIPFGPITDLKFPGSIDIRPSTLVLLVKEICLNLHRDGINKIALVLGHDMSFGALMVAARELAAETNDALRVVVINWLPYVLSNPKRIPRGTPAGRLDTHGGCGETSRAMWTSPELVVRDKLRDFSKAVPASGIPFDSQPVRGGGVYTPYKTTVHDPDYQGIVGFPCAATRELGDLLLDDVAGWVADVASRHCYDTTPPTGHI